MACKKMNCVAQRILLIAILISILLIMFMFNRNLKNPPLKKIYKNITDSATVSSLDSVVIYNRLSNKKVVAVKKGDQWLLANKNYPVNSIDWGEFTSKLSELRLEEMVSSQIEKLKEFGLDSNHRVELYAFSNGKKEYEFYFGKNGIGTSSVYFNSKEDSKVFLSSGLPKYILTRSQANWIDRKPYEINKDNILTAQFFYIDSSSNISLTKDQNDSAQKISLLFNGKNIDDKNKINNWISKLQDLRINDVLNDSDISDSLKSSIANTKNHISITTKTDRFTWKFINNSKDKNGVSFIVYDTSKKRYFVVSKYLINNIAKQKL